MIHTDPDADDEEPSDELLSLYWSELDRLSEIVNKVYNSDDVKRLTVKLSAMQRGPLGVSILIMLPSANNCSTNICLYAY